MTDQQLAAFRAWVQEHETEAKQWAYEESFAGHSGLRREYEARQQAFNMVLHKLEEMLKEPACVECRDKEGK